MRRVHRRVLSVLLAAGAAGYVLWRAPVAEVLRANAETASVVAAGYVFLLATSGYVVRGSLAFAGADPDPAEADTGRAVGKIENVLVLSLTLLGAFTALGLVFTAKSIVRWQDMTSENTTYYLTGSVANITYSFVYGVGLAWVVPLVA